MTRRWKKSPLLELDYAGTRFRKLLDTLVTEAASGNVPPEEIAAFREQDGFTLARADAWLAAHLSAGGEGLAGHLRNLSLAALIDDLLSGGYVASQLAAESDRAAVWCGWRR